MYILEKAIFSVLTVTQPEKALALSGMKIYLQFKK